MILDPLQLYRDGYGDALISVIPPGAPLVPGSKMQASSLGKAPGKKYGAAWGGYAWRTHVATEADLQQWVADGASFGLRADQYPGLDIDCLHEPLADRLYELACERLGPAPLRYGRRPKCLLMYRLAGEPIGRMRLWLEKDGASYLIELLGKGQQYLVAGMHPVTGSPYEWVSAVPPADQLTAITRAHVEMLFDAIRTEFEPRGWHVHREGDGYNRERAAVDQGQLTAPSLAALEALVATIPNDDHAFPGRDDYVRMGYAVKAASGADDIGGYEVFAEWASRHAKDGRVAGNPETWRSDWSRMHGPYAIGWSWLVDKARAVAPGFTTVAEDFEDVAALMEKLRDGDPRRPQALVTGAGAARVDDDLGRTLGDYMEHPPEPPHEVIPKVAWTSDKGGDGMKTLFSGREKIGKSTLVLAGAAAASVGAPFLGEETEPTRVLWLSEEARNLIIRRAGLKPPVGFAAHPENFVIVPMGQDPRRQLAQAIGKWRPQLVVVDTLYRYAPVEDENSASEWKTYLEDFDKITRRGIALVLIAHAKKASEDGDYRGSGALGGWVDAIIKMKNPSPGSTVRELECRGRVDVDDFTVRLRDGAFALLTDEVVSAEASAYLTSAAYQHVALHPGATLAQVRAAIGKKNGNVSTALAALVKACRLTWTRKDGYRVVASVEGARQEFDDAV